MIHLLIPLLAFLLVAGVLIVIDTIRITAQRERRQRRWRERAHRYRHAPTSGHRHGDHYGDL